MCSEASKVDDAEATLGTIRSHLNSLLICYTNSQSLLNELSELGVQIDHHNLLCETKEILINKLSTWSSNRCLILSYFNALNIDWNNLRTDLSKNYFEQQLVDTVMAFALVHVRKSKRYDPDSDSSLMDCILTHHEKDSINIKYLPSLDKSDQILLVFTRPNYYH